MTAAVDRLRMWLDEGKNRGATHVLIICDVVDNEEFPIYVSPNEKVTVTYDTFAAMKQHKVLEVYSLGKDIEMQLLESRAFHLD